MSEVTSAVVTGGSRGQESMASKRPTKCFCKKNRFQENWATSQVVTTQESVELQEGFASYPLIWSDPTGAMPPNLRFRFALRAHDVAPISGPRFASDRGSHALE